MKQNLQTLKGFRDFLPEEKKKRDYVAKKIKEVFELYGFEPLETPTLEYASLLLGKYGEEADKLVFKFEDRGGREVALRYDQTVPMARVISQTYSDTDNLLNNEPKLFSILRRYQIQNVFRADNPQKGRYREFTQCDCDIFGFSSPIADAEILAVFYKVYAELGISNFVIKVNDRESIRNAKDELAGYDFAYGSNEWDERVNSLFQSLDKLDKVSKEEVVKELIGKDFKKDYVEEIMERKWEPSSNLVEIMELTKELGIPENVIQFDPFVVRGLDYYTGLVFECVVPNLAGSLGGGGRYDKLIGQLGDKSCPAVGFGIGFDRTVEVVEELGLLPKDVLNSVAKVLVVWENEMGYAATVANILRASGIATEVFTDSLNFDKQIKYADKKHIPFVVIVGPEEKEKGTVILKDMESGEQEELTSENLVQKLKKTEGKSRDKASSTTE